MSLSGLEIRSDLEDLISEFSCRSDNIKLNKIDEIRTDKLRQSLNPDLEHNFYELLIDHEKDLHEKLLEQLMISP